MSRVMRFNRLITDGAVAVGLYVLTGAGSPGSDCPPSPAVGYYERCAGAVAPALSLRPEEPATGDSSLRRLTKLRYTSELRHLELAAQRVADHQDAPDKLFPILKDVGESRLELCDDPSALIPVLEARLAVLMEQYQDAPMDLADASLVATAEGLSLAEIFTLDHHFRVYRLKGSQPFAIVG